MKPSSKQMMLDAPPPWADSSKTSLNENYVFYLIIIIKKMISKVLKQQKLFANYRNFGAAVQHSRIPTEKEYYGILGISSSATPEEIKEAYRSMVKKHHPDVQGSEQPDSAKFRDVMEAFSVLSVRESRANYDLQKKRNPDAYREVSEA